MDNDNLSVPAPPLIKSAALKVLVPQLLRMPINVPSPEAPVSVSTPVVRMYITLGVMTGVIGVVTVVPVEVATELTRLVLALLTDWSRIHRVQIRPAIRRRNDPVITGDFRNGIDPHGKFLGRRQLVGHRNGIACVSRRLYLIRRLGLGYRAAFNLRPQYANPKASGRRLNWLR
jgi:hypothetical protein